MPAPHTYTEHTLARYMHSLLGEAAQILGWSVGEDSEAAGDYAEAVNETLLSLEVAEISEVPGGDVKKLRALARREVWRSVVGATASYYDTTTDDMSNKRSQVNVQARAAYTEAAAEAKRYEPDPSGVGRIRTMRSVRG